ICFFARNIKTPEQTRELTEKIRTFLPVEPIITIDQEGGLVDRLRRIFTPMPSALSIRQSGNVANARKLGEITAEVLRILGFNMNFAPVLDVIDEARESLSNGLYSRSFGRSTEEVFRYSSAYLSGLQSKGILGCLKHFPGLGASRIDSHDELPLINLPHEELLNNDIKPYVEFFRCDNDNEKVHAVMTGHGAYPELEPQKQIIPASLSKTIVSELLRGKLGYNRLALTDDLEMGAVLRHYSIEDAAKLAFEAGQDVLLICSNIDSIRKSYKSLLSAFKTGKLSAERLDESLQRIAKVKSALRSPAEFDKKRLLELSDEIAKLNEQMVRLK
ncbi:MAG: glycoside hydrolase family 3 N-terminal domain-containing protein, partial [Pyrinomonadaceae bacterium]